MSIESQLFEDLIATSKIQKDDPCLEVKIDEWVFAASSGVAWPLLLGILS